MLDPSALYTVEQDVWESVAGTRPVLIHLLEGHVDAGQITRQLSEHLRSAGDPALLARFDHDQLHDYRSRRPAMVFDTNTWTSLTDYELAIHRVRDDQGRPFLLLSGPEPDTQWNRAARAVLDLVHALDVSVLVSAQGVPMGVPHTRPVMVTGHATDTSLVTDNPVWIDRVTVPGSFSAMLEWRAGQEGRLARGFVGHVPHYLAPGSYVPGALAVLEKVREATGLVLPPGELATLSLTTLSALEEEVGKDAELAGLVGQLEQAYDDMAATGRPAVPSADEIGDAVERFLAERDDEGDGDAAH